MSNIEDCGRPDGSLEGTIQSSIARVLRDRGESVEIIERTHSVYASSHEIEILRCRDFSGRVFEVLCKHADIFTWGESGDDLDHGHYGGVPQEAAVYEHLLDGASLPTVKYMGAQLSATGSGWLLLEHLPDSERLSTSTDPFVRLVDAARWIGSFHKEFSQSLANEITPPLRRYNRCLLLGWMNRAAGYGRRLGIDLSWMADVQEFADIWVGELLSAPQVIIHGEFYPENVLVHDEQILPIDWESAAIGPGEVDLASLTDGWDPSVVKEAVQAYRSARWPATTSAEFERRLTAAQIYVQVRWLGDPCWWDRPEGLLPRFMAFRSSALSFLEPT